MSKDKEVELYVGTRTNRMTCASGIRARFVQKSFKMEGAKFVKSDVGTEVSKELI